jgi:hypothetical protein
MERELWGIFIYEKNYNFFEFNQERMEFGQLTVCQISPIFGIEQEFMYYMACSNKGGLW